MSDLINDDDVPTLPADTQAILQQFLKEKEEREKDGNETEENWNLSQFWYDDETQKVFGKLVKELLKEHDDLKIALLSCPSLFPTISR
jgi:hypothetical protein